MKIVKAICHSPLNSLLACSILATAPGCAVFSKSSTQAQKASEVQHLCFAAASIGTSEALRQKPDWKAQFVAAYQDLDQLVVQKTVTGELLRNVINSLPVKELKSDTARIAIEGATFVFDASVGNTVNIEAQVYVLAAATGIRDGMKLGLGM